MSNIFGPLWQLGYVVADVDAAMAGWIAAGVGPWYLFDPLPVTRFSYFGGPSRVPDVRVALAYSGEVQIELIQQRDDTPSMYRDFLAATGGGLQHLGYLPADFDAATAVGRSRGWAIGHDGEAAGTRFTYFDPGNHQGSVLELVAPTPATLGFFKHMARRAADWDGATDPIRQPGKDRKQSA